MVHVLDIQADPTDRVHVLHVWVMIAPDGGESIISHDLPTEFGPRHMPLMSSKRSVAEKLTPLVKRVQKGMPVGRVERVELRTFEWRAMTVGTP